MDRLFAGSGSNSGKIWDHFLSFYEQRYVRVDIKHQRSLVKEKIPLYFGYFTKIFWNLKDLQRV